MAGKIGELYVEIGAKLEGLTKGLQTATQKINTFAENTKKVDKVLEGFVKLGKTFTVMGGAIVGSMTLAIKQTIEFGDRMWDLSKRTGVSVKELSALKLAADTSGTSIESVAGSMGRMAAKMSDAARGTGNAKVAFDALGISVTDNEGKLRPLNDVLFDVAGRFSTMEDGATKTSLAIDLFGRSGTEMIPMLNLGKDGLKQMADRAKELGIVLDDEAAKAADEFNDKLTELKAAFFGAASQLVQTLMPAIKSFIEGVTNVVIKVREWAAAHPALVGTITKIAAAFGVVMAAIGPLLIIFPKVIQGLAAITTGMRLLLSPTGLLVAAIGTLAFVLYQLCQQEEELARIEQRWRRTRNESIKGLDEVAKAAGVHQGQMAKLAAAYDNEIAAIKRAIQTGEASNVIGLDAIKLKQAMIAYGEKHKKQIDEERKALEEKIKKEREAMLSQMGLTNSTKNAEGAYKDLDGELLEKPKALTKVSGAAQTTTGVFVKQLPAIRDLGDALTKFAPIVDEVAYATEQLGTDTETALTASQQAWLNFSQQVATDIGNVIAEAIKLPKVIDDWMQTWPPLLRGLFKTIYDAFSKFVADLIAKWVTDFLTNTLVKKTAEAVPSVVSGLGDMAKAATGAISGVATSAINTVANVVSAVTGVISLFKKADYSSITYWLKPISERLQEIHDYLFIVLEGQHLGYMHDIMVDDNKCMWDLVYKGQAIVDILASGFGAVVDAIGKIKSYQGGGYVPQTQLAVVHKGEWVMPPEGMSGGGQAGPTAGGPVSVRANIPAIDLNAGIKQIILEIIPKLSEQGILQFHVRGLKYV